MSRSTFVAPNYTPDQFATLFDLPANQLGNAQRYQELRLRFTTLTPAEVAEFANLTNLLQSYIITPERWNHFQDALMGMQWFIKNEVEGYILTKQNEFNAAIGTFGFQGGYSAATRYFRNNIVTFNSLIYLCITSVTAGIVNQPPPTGGLTFNTHWVLVAPQGPQGIQGPPGANMVYRGAYSAASSYLVNDLVTFDGLAYVCIVAAAPGVTPANTTNWQLFARDTHVEMQSFTSSAILASPQNTVNTGLAFNTTDILLVFANSVYLHEGQDYTRNVGVSTIVRVGGGNWGAGTIFNFVVLRLNRLNALFHNSGNSTFNGTAGQTITHNLGTTQYFTFITPTADTGAIRWWVTDRTATTFRVVCSAACSSSFSWATQRNA